MTAVEATPAPATLSRGRARDLAIRWPWWLHPVVLFLGITGFMAVLAIVVPEETYVEWRVPKYLDFRSSATLLGLIAVMFVAMFVTSGARVRGGTATLSLSDRQVDYLRRAYRLLFVLAIVGYGIWFLSAYQQGVSLSTLQSVLSRQDGAISDLKSNARPIGGITTLTQFGPLVVAIGAILARLGEARRWYRVFLVLAAVRTIFYAERLALIEIVLPLVVLAIFTAPAGSRLARLSPGAPLVLIPGLWALFSVSEFFRSWVYYQDLTALPFPAWVSLRLAGYYTTSFNNSALLAMNRSGEGLAPYFSVDGFWNAPIVSAFFSPPVIQGMSPTEWWSYTLQYYGSAEFNNTGSFLVVAAEFSLPLAVLLWGIAGAAVGRVYRNIALGSLPALLAGSTLLVGLLELSRFTYWTQGRAFPLVIALVLIALTYPRATPDGRRYAGRTSTRYKLSAK